MDDLRAAEGMGPSMNGPTLSEAQEQVVEARGHHLQVIACAGSGKTESVACRVAALLAEGVPSEEIVAFTFTERAATELKSRIAMRVDANPGLGTAGRLAQMYVGTIHGYCLRLLQDHVPRYGNFDVLDEHRHAALLFRFGTAIGLQDLADRRWDGVRIFARTADMLSNECIPADRVDATAFGPLHRRYVDVLERTHALTYGRLIECAVQAMEDPRVAARVANGIAHLIVDEYQDINPSQFRLIQLMASGGAEVCAVGDDDQAIYQWRGSSVEYIQDFGRHFPGAKQIALLANRRSVDPIVRVASEFAATIDSRMEKSMESVRGQDQSAVVHFRTDSAEDEAVAVAETIQGLHADGVPYGDMAILFRSVRTSAGSFVSALAERRIPFICAGRSGLFQQPMVRAMAMVHLWLGGMGWWDSEQRTEEPLDAEVVASALMVAFQPPLERDDVVDLLEDLFTRMGTARKPADLIADYYSVLDALGVSSWDLAESDVASRLGSLARFSTVLADFENATRRGRYERDESGASFFRGGIDHGPPYYQRLAGYIAYYAREGYEEFEGEDDAGVDAVRLMTIHGAKGLEWPVVFLPSLQDSRFPTRNMGRAPVWAVPEEVYGSDVARRYAGGEDEERRLFYVAMTRARDLLYLSHFDRTEGRASRRSRFLDATHPATAPLWRAPEIPNQVISRGGTHAVQVASSITELIRFERCGYRHRLQRGFGFETQLVSELGFGRAVHHVLRRVADEAMESGRIPDADRIDTILEGELYFPFANSGSEPLLARKARAVVARYLNRHRDDLDRVWATERPFELHLPRGFLSGRADIILKHESGAAETLAVLDYKSGTSGTSDEELALQLQIYAAAGRAEGLPVGKAYLHDLSIEHGARREISIDEPSCQEALRHADRLLQRLADGDFRPRPDSAQCRECEFRRICRYRADG